MPHGKIFPLKRAKRGRALSQRSQSKFTGHIYRPIHRPISYILPARRQSFFERAIERRGRFVAYQTCNFHDLDIALAATYCTGSAFRAIEGRVVTIESDNMQMENCQAFVR